MKVGIYAPWLHTLGGGEKYICELAIELSHDHDVELIVFTPFDRAALEDRFGFDLRNVGARVLRTPARFISSVPHLRWVMQHRALSRASRGYDVFINQASEQAPFPAYAATNVAHMQMGPLRSKRVRPMHMRFAKQVLDRTLASYDVFLANSQFTKRLIERVYAREATVLYPPCGASLRGRTAKERIILSVGRFFTEWEGPCKKQLEMIRGFKRLYDSTPEAAQWTYHLVGGIEVNRRRHVQYFNACRAEAAGYPIVFHPNAPASVVEDLYAHASLFWHATGFGEDEALHPDRIESFGITTVEAMGAGCVPLVINKGGQPEIVRDGVEGILWDTLDELLEATATLMTDDTLRAAMSGASRQRSKAFSTEAFKARVARLFNEHN